VVDREDGIPGTTAAIIAGRVGGIMLRYVCAHVEEVEVVVAGGVVMLALCVGGRSVLFAGWRVVMRGRGVVLLRAAAAVAFPEPGTGIGRRQGSLHHYCRRWIGGSVLCVSACLPALLCFDGRRLAKNRNDAPCSSPAILLL